MASARGLTLLHLSDLHLGEHHNFADEGIASLLERLRQDVGTLTPDLVIVTGDLTYNALPSEFRAGEQLLVGVVDHFGLARQRMVIVPGNHDVSWAKSRSYFHDCESKEEAPKWPYWPKWQNFVDFFRRFYGEGAPVLTEVQPWFIRDFRELAAAVVGLNSTMGETHRDDEHYGLLGEAQLRIAAGQLASYTERGYLRIAAVHHDILGPEHPRSRADARDLRRILGPHLNLVLHGHQHDGEIGWLERDVPVLGIGSAGVRKDKRPDEVPNQYEWIRVFADRVEVGRRAWIPGQKRWVDDVSADPRGRSGWMTNPVAFAGITTFAASDGSDFSGAASAAVDEERRARALERYRGDLVRTLDLLPLSSVASRGRDDGLVMRLRQVFVAPSAVIEWPRGDLTEDKVEEPQGERPRRAQAHAEPSIDVIHFIADPRRRWLFVMGAPGSGKTSLVNWICSAPEALVSSGGPRVPVWIELSRFHERYTAAKVAGRSIYTFFDFLDEHVAERHGSLRAADFEALAEQGRLYWCFDGLDEVPDARARLDYFERIEGLATSYPACAGTVTCRVAAAGPFRGRFADASGFDSRVFVPCRLLPFSRRQIDAFLDRWHDVVFAAEPEIGAHRQRRIAEALDRSPALAEIAGTPLLLTLLAVLNRGQELPSQRHELYREFVTLMAERWDANKHQRIADRFGIATKLRYLREVAWAMIEASGEASPRSWLVEEALFRFTVGFCRREFGEGAEEGRGTAEALLRQIHERDFLLASRGDGTFCFVHKAIFEYCAATEICERFGAHKWTIEDVAELTASRWRDESWGEILRVVGGILAEREPRHVAHVLRAAWATVRPAKVQDAVLATEWSVRVLACVENLESGVIRSFLARLVAIIEHISVEQLMEFREDWPSWVRVAPKIPEIVGNRERPWAGDHRNLTLARGAVAGLEGRPLILRALAMSESSYGLASVVEELFTLGPWTDVERPILTRTILSTRTSAWDLLKFEKVGIAEARAELLRRLSQREPHALTILMRPWAPPELRERAQQEVIGLAALAPASLLRCHPDVVRDIPSPDIRTEVVLAVVNFIQGIPPAGEFPEGGLWMMWIEYLLLEEEIESLFALWEQLLDRRGPSSAWLRVLTAMCEKGSAPALDLRQRLARDCLEYVFEGQPSTIADFIRHVPEPLPVDGLLQKAKSKSARVDMGLVEAVLAREPQLDEEKLEAILAKFSLDRRHIHHFYRDDRPWLRPSAEASAIATLDGQWLKLHLADPLSDPRVAAQIESLHRDDRAAYARALLELGAPERITGFDEQEMLFYTHDDNSFNTAFELASSLDYIEGFRILASRPIPRSVRGPGPIVEARQRRRDYASRIRRILTLADRIDALLREDHPSSAANPSSPFPATGGDPEREGDGS